MARAHIVVVHTSIHTSGLATTILAALGVLLALLSLAWQAWSFRLSGSRVTVEVRSGVKSVTGAATIPGTASASALEQLRVQGFDEPALGIRVNNAGRGPTSAVRLDLHFGKGAAVTNTVFDPSLPFRLDGESEQTWLFDAQLAKAYAQTLAKTLPDGHWQTVRARAWIGGREAPIESKNEAKVL
jgi:hypothetical protein